MKAKSYKGVSIRVKTGCGSMHTIINEERVLVRLGKAGSCAAAQCDALGLLITELRNRGMGLEEVAKMLSGIQCHRPSDNPDPKKRVVSCPDAIAVALRDYEKI